MRLPDRFVAAAMRGCGVCRGGAAGWEIASACWLADNADKLFRQFPAWDCPFARPRKNKGYVRAMDRVDVQDHRQPPP